MTLRYWAALGSVLVLAGCAGADAIDPMKPFDAGDHVQIVPQVKWAKVNIIGTDSFWTIDGVGLDEMHFYMGIADGSPLFSIPGVSDKDIGAYKSTMLPNDVADLLASAMLKAQYQTVHTSNLAPCPFGSLTGFCFDLDFATASGLNMKGRALAAQRGGRLDLMLYMAPAEYYFDHWAGAVKQMYASIQMQ